ncbi:MAG: TRAP transporter large permease subunit, partial [Sneathiella sp.]
SFIMGIGMTVTAAYIFLAIVLAPALIQGGLNPMSVHLFILYWGMVSFITPPVALGAFAAASIAGASPMRTGFEAMRLGSIIYFVPFFFVLDPAFILQGEFSRTVVVFGSAIVGVILIASALQGYLMGVGNLHRHPVFGWLIRGLMLAGGLCLATPGGSDLIPYSDIQLALTALILAGSAAIMAYLFERSHQGEQTA